MDVMQILPTGTEVTIPSGTVDGGTETLTGKVSRTSARSMWVTFNGQEYRFTQAQDQRFRQHGRVNDQYAQWLRVADPAPAAAPVTHAPIHRADFDETQAELAQRIEAVMALGRTWGADEAKAREKAADPARQLSSFLLDELTRVAGTQEARADIHTFRRRVAECATISETGTGYFRIMQIDDGPALTEVVRGFTKQVRSRTARFYKPNSTSVSDVEIKLYTYESYNMLERTLNGNYGF